MIVWSYSNIDIIQGVLGYGNVSEGVTDWRITNTNNGTFNILNSSSIIRPSGGTSEIGEIPGSTDRYMIFTAGSSTFTVPSGGIICDILVVGGGGGGGTGHGGGGGAGALIYTTNQTLSSGAYTINVGNGGAAVASRGITANNGQSSSILFNSSTIYLAIGGGGGGGAIVAGANGGSGGGGDGAVGGTALSTNTPSGTYGFAGGTGGFTAGESWSGGGGGGAGAVGGNAIAATTTFAGNGGIGREINITGTTTYYAGGGGGGVIGNPGSGYITNIGSGGNGGGGAGGKTSVGVSGLPNTGGGGGGGGFNRTGDIDYAGGAGGSGIVIIRYRTANISIIDNGNVGIGITPITTSSLLEVAGDVNITGNYRINTRDVINDTSNYVGTTSNILISRILTDVRNTSNYVSSINTSLNTRINDTSNYITSTSNILVNNINSKWITTSSGIYYNTPISTPMTFPNEIGVEKYMVFTYTGDTISGSGQTQYTINIPTGGILCDILVVGGGGSGGNDRGGGGGGGGVIYSQNITLNGTFTILVGNGGIGATSGLPSGSGTRGTSGANSSISGSSLTTITAIGGGAGGSCHPSVKNGLDGGSGGGGSQYGGAGSGGIGTTRQGNNGGVGYEAGAAGGGGGAVAVGTNATSTNAGNGGIGISISITGTSVIYGSGGGGGGSLGGGISGYTQVFGTGGSIGAGDGANGHTNGNNATIYGCGGGGGGLANTIVTKGGNGAPGVVIIKYISIQQTIQKSISASLVTSPTVTTGITTGTIGATDGYMMFTYTTDNTGLGQTRYAINITQNIICEFLIVGGGGGGARRMGGGGGAGALIYDSNLSFPAGTYYIHVGNGGSGNSKAGNISDTGNTLENKRAQNGFDSEIISVQNASMTPVTIYRAKGGGGGLGGNSATSATIFPNEFSPLTGGSGGGNGGKDGAAGGLLSGLNIVNGSFVSVINNIASDSVNPSYVGGKCFGNEGGRGGGDSPWLGSGGGGAGSRGADVNTLGNATANNFAGVGGNGLQYSITGTSVYYAGGGGGGNWDTNGSAFYNDGGLGGGGRSSTKTVAPIAGTPNTGGGGGGDGADIFSGANGGSGVVIIKYYSIQQNIQQYITSSPVIVPNVITGITTGTFGTTDSFMMFTYTIDNTGTGQTQYNINIRENINCDILIVGGGGGGGRFGGGGGGGSILFGTNIALNTGSYTIRVGDGGAGDTTPDDATDGINGFDSSIIINSVQYIAKGGGGGGSRGVSQRGRNGVAGGSGGGGSGTNDAAYIGYGGVSNKNTYDIFQSFGNNGGQGKPDLTGSPNYSSGGGGGAGSAGSNFSTTTGGGNGGTGKEFISYFGTAIGDNGWFGGGGGGNTYEGAGGSSGIRGFGNGGNGLFGGGGNGGYDAVADLSAVNGMSNTGGGGGGSIWDGVGIFGGRGGSGVVIIRYRKVTTTAYVGLGTTNPVSELHVYDDTVNNTKLTIQNNYIEPVVVTPNIIESLVLPNPLFASNPTGVTSGTINDTDRFYIFTHTGGYNTNTGYTVSIPNGIIFDILMIGGGGAGGGIGGAGGGSGACLVAINQTLTAGTYTFAVGGAGSGGITGSGNFGYDTYIGANIYKARGGGGGAADAKNGVIGGCSGGAAGGINNVVYTSPSPSTDNYYQTQASGPIVNTTLSYSIYANKGGDVTAETSYNTINYGGGGGIGAAAANANTTTKATPGGDGLYQVTLNGTLYNLRAHFTNNGTFGVQDGTTGNFFIGGGGGGGGYNPFITPTNISGGKGGGGIGKNGNSPANGTDGTPNTGSGGGAGSTGAGGNSFGGNGGSGLLIFRYRNRAKYRVTETLENNTYYKTLTFAYSPNYPPDPPNSTLLAWYKFDGDGLDYTPWATKYNLTANVGTPTYSSGTSEDSFFQGRRYINTASGSLKTSLSLSSRTFSVAVWQRRKNSNRALFVAQGTVFTTNTTVLLGCEGNNTYMIAFHGNDLVSPSFPSDINTWVHIVYVVLPNNNNRRIYRNGVLIATDAIGSATNASGDLRFGAEYGNNASLNIDFSDLRIYNNGLSNTDVEKLYYSYTTSSITDNYGINFTNTLGLTVNGLSKTVKGLYNISTGYINSSMLPLGGQTDTPLASTAITTLSIKYPYDTPFPILPNEIGVDKNKYMIFTYTGDTIPGTGQTQYTIDIPTGGITCDILMVGGGGGGGNWSGGNYECGGGGAGAYLYNQNIILNSGAYTFSVGKGGELSTKGSNTEIKSGATILYSCEGGGNGGFNGGNAGNGGSGGGGQFGFTFGVANDSTKGFNGASGATNSGVNEGGGGGGSGGTGLLRDGGIGKINNITGVNVYYAGGGGGCSYRALGGGVGGLGGGGTGSSSSRNATDGENNTGSGGGGGYYVNSRRAGKGGSGIIIIKNNTIEKSISSSPELTGITKGTIGTSDRTISFRYIYDSPGLTGQTLYTFTPSQNVVCDILVVGGGGGGGKGGGGGGGGGVLFGVNLKLNSGSSVSVKVGKGGTGATTNDNAVNGINGYDSSITINSIEYIAKGGGGGGTRGVNAVGTSGNAGGSGGGGSHANSAPQGQGGVSNKNNYANFQSFGNSGGLGKLGTSAPEPSHASGGGGGAGSAGSNATGSGSGKGGGDGGFGKEFIAYFGRSVGHNGYFAGGGGGQTYSNAGIRGYGNGGLELYGGGGNAGFDGTMAYFADDGLPNTGGGGGGAFFSIYGYNSSSGGNGGSGFVIIRYRINTMQTASIELIRNTMSPNEILVSGATSTTIGQFDRLISFPYTSTSLGLTGQTQYIFTTTENLICDILIIGGGGGGSLGGGGAGSCIVAINQEFPIGTYSIFVGIGGTGGSSATNGADSLISLNGTTRYLAKGGGSGGYNSQVSVGGCGGGGGYNPATHIGGIASTANIVNAIPNIAPSITSTYAVFGTNGGTVTGSTNDGFGGGGGIGIAGGNFNQGLVSGLGGDGLYQVIISSQIYNFKTYFANNTNLGVLETDGFYYIGGGGGGASYNKVGSSAGSGGKGGGGRGGDNKISSTAVAGTANTGSGGGGNDPSIVRPYANGGSGIVIIRYRRNTGYKIGNYNGDFKIISSSYSSSNISTDTDYMRITRDGASIYNPTGSPLWSTVSDRRIKENIEKASYDKCYDNINKLELYRFNYIKELNNINKDNKQLGYIAQEVEDVFPKAISTQPFYNNSLSISDLLSIDITQINYSLYGAVKKLIEMYNDIEKKVDALEKILNIENKSNIDIQETLVTTSNFNIDIFTSNNISFYAPSETNIIVNSLTKSNVIDILSTNAVSIYTSNNIIYDISSSNNISFYNPTEANIVISITESTTSNVVIE